MTDPERLVVLATAFASFALFWFVSWGVLGGDQ
jgi:hypothetical protein